MRYQTAHQLMVVSRVRWDCGLLVSKQRDPASELDGQWQVEGCSALSKSIPVEGEGAYKVAAAATQLDKLSFTHYRD
jgi:hypothetical protein